MNKTLPSLLVSTDLDGTLLDHHHYDWTPAKPAIERLKSLQIPVIFNTSKTLAEAHELQRELGIHAPIIVENGSALCFTDTGDPLSQFLFTRHFTQRQTVNRHTAYVFGRPLEEIRHFISAERDKNGAKLEGYSDWSNAQIQQKTGLTLDAVARSRQKAFSEPFIWQGSSEELEQFTEVAKRETLTILKGGRFFHLQGNNTKATPITWLREEIRKAGGSPKWICLGDNHNDVAMVNAADYPVLVRSPTSDFPTLDTQAKVIRTEACGPTGWNTAIHAILDRIDTASKNSSTHSTHH